MPADVPVVRVQQAVAGIGTAWARTMWGWDGALALWIGSAVLAAGLMLLLWNYKTEANAVFH